MSWICEVPLPWYSILILKILKCGRVPNHVAFIMDGNRRFARKSNMDKIMEGHTKGVKHEGEYSELVKISAVCWDRSCTCSTPEISLPQATIQLLLSQMTRLSMRGLPYMYFKLILQQYYKQYCQGSRVFDKLSEVLQWCMDLGIKEVTVYAFSIENFKRTKEEVDGLMNLARDKFKRVLEERHKLMKHGLRIRIIGNRSYLPEDVAKLAAEAELLTRRNNQAILNVAFSYTAQDEITNSLNTALYGLNENWLEPSHINLNMLSKCLYTQESPFPDVLIRTSGETRLSDFLLWQSCATYLHFTGILWPELTIKDFLLAIFKYQRVANELDSVRAILNNGRLTSPKESIFVETVEQKKWSELQRTLTYA